MIAADVPSGSNRRFKTAAVVYPLLCGLLAAVGYANILGNGFCEDDFPIIVDNPLVTAPGHWADLWLTEYWHAYAGVLSYRDLLYRPVAILSYRFNHTVHGLEPFGYLLTNLVLHAVVCILVYRLVFRMLDDPACAVAAGCVFAILPIHSEAVAHIVGRAELLVALFTLVAILTVLPRPASAATRPRHRSFVRVGVAAVCVFLAMGSKETGAAAVVLVPLFAWYGRRFGPSPTLLADSPRVRINLPRYGALLSVLVASVAYLPLRYFALHGQLFQSDPPAAAMNLVVGTAGEGRWLTLLQLWGMYWAKTVWPSVLVCDYSAQAIAPAARITHPHVLVGLIAAVGLAGIAVAALRARKPEPAVWVLAVLASYAPVSNAVVLLRAAFAERVWYFPSVWVTALTCWVICVGLLNVLKVSPARQRTMRRALVLPLSIVLVAGSVRTWLRNAEWKNNGTLFAAAYRDHPDSANVLFYYGSWLASHGSPDRGLELLRRSVQIDLGDFRAHWALGTIYLERGEVEAALRHLMIAKTQAPGHEGVLTDLERAEAAVREHSAHVLADLERQAAAEPRELTPLLELVDRLIEAGRLADANHHLHNALDHFPNEARVPHRLAVVAAMDGRTNAAIEQYRRAIALAPDNASFIVELAMLLMDRCSDGDVEEANSLVETAVRLDPENVQVRIARAEVLVMQGRRSEAAEIYRVLARSLPKGSELQERCALRAEHLEP